MGADGRVHRVGQLSSEQQRAAQAEQKQTRHKSLLIAKMNNKIVSVFTLSQPIACCTSVQLFLLRTENKCNDQIISYLLPILFLFTMKQRSSDSNHAPQVHIVRFFHVGEDHRKNQQIL